MVYVIDPSSTVQHLPEAGFVPVRTDLNQLFRTVSVMECLLLLREAAAVGILSGGNKLRHLRLTVPIHRAKRILGRYARPKLANSHISHRQPVKALSWPPRFDRSRMPGSCGTGAAILFVGGKGKN